MILGDTNNTRFLKITKTGTLVLDPTKGRFTSGNNTYSTKEDLINAKI